MEAFSPVSLPIFWRRASFSWLFCSILCLYYWSYLIIFWFCWAESLRFSWADFISSSNPTFSFTSLVIFSWRVPIVWFIPSISWSRFLRLPISWFFFSRVTLSLSIYWERSAILVYISAIFFLLVPPTYWILLFRS